MLFIQLIVMEISGYKELYVGIMLDVNIINNLIAI